ncbi:MAG: ATP-binding protein [Actinomycetes bacterium]
MTPVELLLPSGVAAPGRARSAVRSWLDARPCDPSAADTAALLVTEVVTNAVLHAKGAGLSLTIDEVMSDVMHVAVRDQSRQTPSRAARRPDEMQTGGRGLWLVEALASSWGWEPLRGGKRVWFELPCRPAREGGVLG